ncbi:MAG: cellulose synthase operon protein YhjQ/BcsQ, partial [Planctomycetota bacterium]
RTLPTFVLPTIHDTDSALAEDLLEELRRRFGGKVSPTPVRRDGALREAASFGQPIVEYAPESPGAQDYAAVTRWLVEGLKVAKGTPAPPPSVQRPAAPAPSGQGEDLAARAAQLREHVVRLSGGRTALMESKPADSPDHLPGQSGRPQGAQVAAPNAPATTPNPAPTSVSGDANEPEVVQASPGSTVVRLVEDDRPTEVHPSARRILGATPTSQGVVFVQPVSVGRHVAIAGAFNNWSPETHRLTLNNTLGVYEICIPLPEGRHPYKLVVDGRWTNDPFNAARVDDERGGHNTVVEVPPSPRTIALPTDVNARLPLNPSTTHGADSISL